MTPKKAQKNSTIKYDVICGTGKHKSWTACLAELILLNKYGSQKDYFWRDYMSEYTHLIKMCGRLGKIFGQNKLAWYIYKESTSNFSTDIGLITWKLKGFKFDKPEFTVEELVRIYKNKYRPEHNIKVENPIIVVTKEKPSMLDILGDI